jgi:putative endonuclease
MSWWVYLLECRDGSLYCGSTNDLGHRLAVHAAGRGSRYVRSRLPFRLALSIPVDDRSHALRLERAIKKMSHSAKRALADQFQPKETR